MVLHSVDATCAFAHPDSRTYCRLGASRARCSCMPDVTTLLSAARDGEKRAANQLYQLLYQDLRRVARQQLRKSFDHQLETTSLINECYLRLSGAGGLKPRDRQHFLAYAASVMRSVIVDLARGRLTEKRGGGQAMITLRTAIGESVAGEKEDADVVRIHEALEELAAIDVRLARIVEMRYFAGMSEVEVAEALGISRRTAQRDWEKARLFLHDALASK
jgi:RNA polymerase sigma factor (TIGR02999 family)